MKFKNKLMMMFGGILVVCYAMLGALVMSYMSADELYSNAIDSSNVNLTSLSDLSNQILLKQVNTTGYLINGDNTYLTKKLEVDEKAEDLFKQAESLNLTEEQVQQLEQLYDLTANYDQIAQNALSFMQDGKQQEAILQLTNTTQISLDLALLLDEMR